MKKQHYKNLRYSEKIKESECFIQADGLQKKIRKFNANKAACSINADMKMRQIECFWKEGWEYNHTHHIYLEPKVTRPQFYLPNSRSQIHPKLERYYQLLNQYLTRLKIDNEDETNFKIDKIDFSLEGEPKLIQMKSQMEMELEGVIDFEEKVEDQGIISLSFTHLIQVIAHISNEMISNFAKSLEISQNEMMNESLEQDQITHLQYISETCRALLQKTQSHEYSRSQTELFMRLLMENISQSKQNKQYSAVIPIQPVIGELTNILHPFCWGLYSTFSKEILVKDAKKRRGKRYADQYDQTLILNSNLLKQNFSHMQLLNIQDNFKLEQEKHSKILFINLDGYESEFNVQFLRNFADNLMYISFPKFQSKDDMKFYNNRFYKKIMYNFTRSELDILGYCEQEHEGMNLTIQREDLLINPEKYHQTIDKIYKSTERTHRPNDFNKNIFIFPVKMDNLESEQDISSIDKRIEGYESQFIRFILRDQLYTAMKAFKPHTILISYTGKIQIENEHFLELLQEITKICPKITFFPNFTSALNQQPNIKLSPATHNIGRGIINRDDESNIEFRKNKLYEEEGYNPLEVDLMDKLNIFLKVSAGYYNVVRPYQEEDLHTKYKNLRVFRYIIHIYNALKNQYEHCKRRIQSTTLQASRASLENTIKEYSKQINRCVPDYYKRMFNFISELLRRNIEGSDQYNLAVQEIRDLFPATFQEDEPYIQQWMEIQKAEELMLASAKYHEISQIQIRQKTSREEYIALKDERMNNLDSLYRISFYYKDESNQIVKLYKDVSLLYKENQNSFNKNYFYIALTNLFTPKQQEIQHYIAKPKLNNKKLQRCQIIPINFYNKNGLIKIEHIYKVWTQWNYTETTNQIILYWPSDFDFISYYLSKILKRKYEPTVLHHVFAAKKSSQSLNKNDSTFYEINFGDNIDVAPRWGCSSFNVDDQLYIFGGSYGSEKSYLNLQNDVTTIDLTDNNLHDFPPTKLRNINKQLYANEAFWGKLRQGIEVNHFIRPRLQFEFYDQKQLLLDEDIQQTKKDDDKKKIYMIGGYGEEFKTPYSLFVNYFYEITIEKSTRRLTSIKKLVIPEKVIPINVKGMIKNRGIYQKANILESTQANEEQQKCKEGMTNNRHYFHHRIVYAIKNKQLLFKIKNLFAIQLYENSKKDYYNFARKIGEVRNTEQPEPILIRKVQSNKHQVLVQIGDLFYLYSLNLQLTDDEVEEIPLMNESIIALDTKKMTICALISHSKHTHSKCILALESVRLPSQAIIDRQKHYALTLKEVVAFEQQLNLHTLITCNVNEIALLHGISFQGCKNKEYLIKIKTKSQIKKQEINIPFVSLLQFSSITTFFTKKNNIINSINFLQFSEPNHYFAINRLTLDINRFAQGWKPNGQINKICFVNSKTILQKINFQARIDGYGDINSIVILIYTLKKAYHIKLCEIPVDSIEVPIEELKQKTVVQKYKCMQCLAKVIKNQDLYEDFSYFGL